MFIACEGGDLAAVLDRLGDIVPVLEGIPTTFGQARRQAAVHPVATVRSNAAQQRGGVANGKDGPGAGVLNRNARTPVTDVPPGTNIHYSGFQ